MTGDTRTTVALVIGLIVASCHTLVFEAGLLLGVRGRCAHSIPGRCTMPLFRRSTAELLGTFWLVLGGCGSAVLSAAVPDVGIGWLGVSLAFGLTVLTMAYAIGHVSGCHLNPAVSLGLWAAKRFPSRELPAYIVAQ